MLSTCEPSWGEFLNPEVMRPRLIAASLYIAAFESLKDAIVSRPRSFYSEGFDESGEQVGPRYATEVLSRNRSTVHASLQWLRDQGAVSEDDISAFMRAKELRNLLAHDLLKKLERETLLPDVELGFRSLLELLRKVEVWWIANVEVPMNPDFDSIEVAEHDILPGSVAGLHMLIHIALGDEAVSRAYYDGYLQRRGGGHT
jgi:hypothetical protein